MDFTVSVVAEKLGVHRNTILNWESKGFIHSSRDVRGYRRYSVEELEKLRTLLEARWPSKYSEKNRNYPETQENDESTNV